MDQNYLGLFLLCLLRLIDRGRHARITIPEVVRLCENRGIIDWLRSEFPDEFLAIHLSSQNEVILDDLARWSKATTPSTYYFENSGICLLSAWLNEIAGDRSADESIWS